MTPKEIRAWAFQQRVEMPKSTLLETPESSQIRDVLFVASLSQLMVWFRSGAIYSYECDEALFEEFKKAPSKGSFVSELTVYTCIRRRDGR